MLLFRSLGFAMSTLRYDRLFFGGVSKALLFSTGVGNLNSAYFKYSLHWCIVFFFLVQIGLTHGKEGIGNWGFAGRLGLLDCICRIESS